MKVITTSITAMIVVEDSEESQANAVEILTDFAQDIMIDLATAGSSIQIAEELEFTMFEIEAQNQDLVQ